MRYLVLVGVLLLSGCVTDGQGYVRANGRTNPERLRLALAECQGEAALPHRASGLKASDLRAWPET